MDVSQFMPLLKKYGVTAFLALGLWVTRQDYEKIIDESSDMKKDIKAINTLLQDCYEERIQDNKDFNNVLITPNKIVNNYRNNYELLFCKYAILPDNKLKIKFEI